jgi:NADH-quinone oxidoreductase subunit J
MLQVIFVLVAAVTLFSALLAVTSRKMMHAALWLVLALFGVAIIFAMLEASFFAVVQVLVYIGAIAILIIFAVMLTRGVMDESIPQLNKHWWVALLACVGLFGGMLVVFGQWELFEAGPGSAPDAAIIQEFGMGLVDPAKYAVPFEIASVLLLAALVGAIYIAADRKGGGE